MNHFNPKDSTVSPNVSDESRTDVEVEDAVSRKPTWLRTIVKGLLVTAAAIALLLAIGYLALQQSPVFYRSALLVSDEEAYEAGQSLEVAALYWRNDVIEADSWLAEFSDDQVNGWLASDLPRKFPSLLPDEIRNPRVAIEPGSFKIALTTDVRDIETVLTAAIEFFPTEITNRLGVRILSVHAGWAPIPITIFTQPATDLLQQAGIEVQWYDDSGGYPVALLTIPKTLMSHEGQHVVIEQLEIADGSVRLAGRSESIDKPAVATMTLPPVSEAETRLAERLRDKPVPVEGNDSLRDRRPSQKPEQSKNGMPAARVTLD